MVLKYAKPRFDWYPSLGEQNSTPIKNQSLLTSLLSIYCNLMLVLPL